VAEMLNRFWISAGRIKTSSFSWIMNKKNEK
jgi:hypothetical protein